MFTENNELERSAKMREAPDLRTKDGTRQELERGKNGGTEEDREKLASTAKEQAIRLLARRDHSRHELRRKLAARGHPADVIDAAIAPLAESGLQSDERFTENFVRSALNRGHGERKIRAGLRLRGIPDRLAATFLNLDDEQWRRLADEAVRKRFGETPPTNRIELGKRVRFLVNRGFSGELAFRVLGDASAFEG